MTKYYTIGGVVDTALTGYLLFSSKSGAGISATYRRTMELNGAYYQITATKGLIITKLVFTSATIGAKIDVGYATVSGYQIAALAGEVDMGGRGHSILAANGFSVINTPIIIPAVAAGYFPLIVASEGTIDYTAWAYEF